MTWITTRVGVDPATLPSEGHQDGVIYLTGSARQRGITHGRVAKAKIDANLEIVHRTIASAKTTVFEGRLWEALEHNARFVASQSPETAEEIAGIAEGVGVEERYAWALSCPVHVLQLALDQECSQLLVEGRRGGGDTFLAKTRDFHAVDAYAQVVLHHVYPDGQQIAAMHTAGSITYPGLAITSDGLAFSTSGVFSPLVTDDPQMADRAWILFNGQVIARGAKTVQEFAERAGQQPRFRGINMLATDGTESMSLQLTGDRVVATPAEDEFLQLTNHYQGPDPELQRLTPREEQAISSYARASCARQYLSEAEGWTVADVAEAVSSHDGYPNNSICRHVDPEHPGSSGTTVAASIARLSDKSLHTALGNPCTADHSTLPAA